MSDLPEAVLSRLAGRVTRIDHAGITLVLPAVIRIEWLGIGITGISVFLGILFGYIGFVTTLMSSSVGALLLYLLWRRVSVRIDGQNLTFRWGLAPESRLPLGEIRRIERRPQIGLRLYQGGGVPLELFLPGLPDPELDAVEQIIRHAVRHRAGEHGSAEDVAPALRGLVGRLDALRREGR